MVIEPLLQGQKDVGWSPNHRAFEVLATGSQRTSSPVVLFLFLSCAHCVCKEGAALTFPELRSQSGHFSSLGTAGNQLGISWLSAGFLVGEHWEEYGRARSGKGGTALASWLTPG